MRHFILTSQNIAACPKHSLSPSHYRWDGSCRCQKLGRVTEKLCGAGWELEITGTPTFVDETVRKTVPWLQRFADSIESKPKQKGTKQDGR